MNLAQHGLVFGVRVYQRVFSPMLAGLAGPAGRCRFVPSCSQYALEAVQSHGALRGSMLAALRLGRCGPWGGCGHDPVPPEKFKVEGLRFKVLPEVESPLCQQVHATNGVSQGRS